ncbi:AGL088Cp [Eremothecium gossypii ATCC 10895]|uniref:AGL088Cp n=1 Tax=Eremothecium gossypii (strain ATCC 10895 / CBS 109.51 / FGSC 9923 / NRRL Y-1056) TaxID=284811 RepID=Q750N8_EREGS|nr:AGL088Cp [Eremothecium gossypii ATCC 10895]AAS54402.1 AGL088Cp [Eremothecium gossypii ATCC 10895]AEY98730.1 FAGL088Cp [Eremothecium gossypii FDAG1]
MSETRSYYSVISDLSCFEASDKVSFTREQLMELTQQEVDAREMRDNLERSEWETRKRLPMHSYLGQLAARDAEEAAKHPGYYTLQHTLLGGYVPRHQLESLSSTDFAHYLHKVLECEGPLDSYGKYVNVGRIPIGSAEVAAESPMPLAVKAPVPMPGLLGTPGSSSSTKVQTPSSSATPSAGTPPIVNTTIKKAGESHIKKVVLCKLCKKRFSGPRRFTEFSNHMCMKG